MPIELQSDLLVNDFWREAKGHMSRLVRETHLARWRIVLRPATQADEKTRDDQLQMTIQGDIELGRVEEVARGVQIKGWIMSINGQDKSCEFMLPEGSDHWIDPYGSGERVTPEIMACQLLDALEMASEK